MRGSLLLLLVVCVSVAIVSGGRGKKSKKPKSRGDKTGDDRYRIPEVMPGLRSPQQMLVRSGKVDNERQLKVLKRKDFHKNKFGDTFDHMTPISLASALDDLEPENRPDATVSVVKLGQQTSDGIPVFGRTVTMMLDADGLSTQISEQGLIKNLDAKVEKLKKRKVMSGRSALKACLDELKLMEKGIGPRDYYVSGEYNVYAFSKKNQAGNNRRHSGTNHAAPRFSSTSTSTDEDDDVTLIYDFSFTPKPPQANNERNNGRSGNKNRKKGGNSYDLPYLTSYNCLVDVVSHKVLEAYESLMSANSKGGTVDNEWGYGDLGDREPLDVVELATGQCIMETPMKSNKSLPSPQGFQVIACDNSLCLPRELYTFNCSAGPNNTVSINGGLAPHSDTFYHLSKAYDSLIELGAEHTDIIQGPKVKVFVFGDEISKSNAHFISNGFSSYLVFFGGVRGIDRPFGICADIAAHELGHSVTFTTSKLIYRGESGCLNEAFSDWMGEYVEWKVAGDVDWLMGADCLRRPSRSFEEPTRFNQIDHYSDFHRGLPPHYCSGIMNRMFYNLCHMPNWDITKAFRTALYAQMLHWNSMITMHDAGCGMMAVVAPDNQKIQDITAAFSIVGLDLTDCSSYVHPPDPSPPIPTTPIPTTTTTTLPPFYTIIPPPSAGYTVLIGRPPNRPPPNATTITNTLPYGFYWCQTARGLSAYKGAQDHYLVGPVQNEDIMIAIEGDNGDADAYIRTTGSDVSTEEWDYRMVSDGSVDDIVIRNANSPSLRFIIHAKQAYRDLTLKVCFG